jgi:hypothetical protein
MKLAALLAATALTVAFASPAAASEVRVAKTSTPVVHVSLVGKSVAQIDADIQAAAATVCGDAKGPCAAAAVRDANHQLAAINRAHARANEPSKVDVARADPKSVRVAVTGRSLAQINADIDAAAKTVCKSESSSSYRDCVDGAVRSAKAQLREMAQASRPEQVASR